MISYLKARLKQMVTGFCLGMLAGYARSYYFESDKLDPTGHLILALQTGIAFAALALFVTNYLELRQRVLKKVAQEKS
jgi:hypothetical protein